MNALRVQVHLRIVDVTTAGGSVDVARLRVSAAALGRKKSMVFKGSSVSVT